MGHFRNLTDSRASLVPKGISRTHSPWGVESKTPPWADRSSGLCRYREGGAAPTPAGPCAAREGQPGRARRLTAPPARRDLLLTWSHAVARSDRRAGRPSPPRVCFRGLPRRLPHCRTPLSALRPQPRSPCPRPPLRDSPPWDAATPHQWL